ncbi:MAG: major facilitator superfamily 1 [Pelosinus sp.]|jgi:YNFM family putative membrane transporter|nr:major facilitator superfamily 1 [Pelosinus sp.]
MREYIQKGSRRYWRGISALFWGSFVTFALLYCTQPLIPAFSAEFKVAPSYASLSISFVTGFLAACMLFMSWLSDIRGRKTVMVMALLSSAVLAIIISFTHNFELLLALRALQGIMLAGYPAIAMAYVNEEFDPKVAGLVMGIYISGNSVGGLAGRIIVSTLTDLFSWHIALAGIGVISLLASIWFWVGLPESSNFSPEKRELKEVFSALARNLRNTELLLLNGIGFLIMGGFVTLYNYIGYSLMSPPYNLSQTVVGCIFVVYLIGTFSSTYMGKLADDHGSSRILCLSIGIMLLGCLITLHSNLYIKIIGVAMLTFGFFGSHSVASSWVGKCALFDKAQAASLYLLFYYGGASILGTMGGQFLSWYGWEGVVFLIGFALMLALVFSTLLLFKEIRYKIYSTTQS